MSSPYTPPGSAFHAAITTITDDDAVDVPAWNTPYTELADNIAYLARRFFAVSGSGGLTTLTTVNTGGLTNVGTMTLTPAKVPAVGDLLVVRFHGCIANNASAARIARIQLTLQSASQAQAQLGASLTEMTLPGPSATSEQISAYGVVAAPFAEAFTFKVQAYNPGGSAGNLSVLNSWTLSAEYIRAVGP